MKAPGEKTSYWWYHDGLENMPNSPVLSGQSCLWLIISWYPAFKWLPHLDKTITVVVPQMLCYTRNIILITKKQLVARVSQLPWTDSAMFCCCFFPCSIKAANVPQEGLLLGAFASKHSWGWCCHYVQLLGVLVICRIPLECDRTPRGGKGGLEATCRNERFRSSGWAG